MRISAIFLTLVFFAGMAAAQTHPSPEPVQIFKRRVDLVNLVFTVTDRDNRFVKDLQQDDFAVLDNGKPPAQVLAFEAQTDLPLRVGLLIDASSSVRVRFHFEQQAAIEFLNQIIRPQSDKALVLAFDEVYEVRQDFTNDLEKLIQGVRSIRPGGGTAMWDAVYYACREKLLQERETGPVRRAIILLSDGDDNQSRVYPREAIEMAQRAEVIIYTINTDPGHTAKDNMSNLKDLAEATGGRAFSTTQMEEVSDAFLTIAGELRSQYSIAYKPADLQVNGKFRTIQISPKNKTMRVRARKGYFAPTR